MKLIDSLNRTVRFALRSRSRRRTKTLFAPTATDSLESRLLLAAPQAIQIESVSEVNPGEIEVVWLADAEAARYEVIIRGRTDPNFIHQVSVTDTSYSLPGLPGNAAYRVFVRGFDSAGAAGVFSQAEEITLGTIPPIAPVFLNSTGDMDRAYVADTTPTYSWVHNESEYEIWVSKAGTSGPFLRATVTGNEFTPETPFEEGVYKLWVRSKDGNSLSRWVGPITTAIGASQPQLTAPTESAPAQPTIEWSEGLAGVDYQLWVNRVGGPSRVILEQGLTTNSFTPTSDLTDGIYNAWVRQTPDNAAPLPWSPVFRFAVGSSSIPATPVLSGSGADSAATLTWSSVAGATRYEIWVSDTNVGRIQHDTQLTALQYDTGELSAAPNRGTTYRVWLRAFNSADVASAWSSFIAFTVFQNGDVTFL